MRCTAPNTAYTFGRNPKTGKPFVKVVGRGKEISHLPANYKKMFLPCGQCTECRLEKSKDWAIRCMHESQMHPQNHFITLTYSDENLPRNNSLDPGQLKNFIKKVRKDRKFRYFACGEYGDKTGRPHYHAILFGLELDDLEYYKTENENQLFTSKYLDSKWKHGHVIVGNVTFESCAYVARYILKKQNGENFAKRYVDLQTGELLQEPEFVRMSNRPGIGFDFYRKYMADIYQKGTDGTVYIRGGIPCKTPRYYDNQFEKDHPERMAEIKLKREEENAKKGLAHLKEDAINSRKAIANHRQKQLIRNLE